MRAKEFLSQRGVAYTEKRVDQDRAAAVEMIRLSGQQGVPVIHMDGQVIVGFDQRRLAQLLAARTTAGTADGADGAAAAPQVSLGAQVADAAPILHKQGKPGLSGAYVGGIRTGSPADQAGLQAGDVITAVGELKDLMGLAAALKLQAGDGITVVGERLVRTADDLARALAPLVPGSLLRLTVQRSGTLTQIVVHF